MDLFKSFAAFTAISLLSGCAARGTNPADPYEAMNRKTDQFNQAVDATVLKPMAKVYRSVLPEPVRASINNAYNNVNLIPTIANDALQAEWQYAIKDTWRLIINSTFGVAGLFEVAEGMQLPPHSNDLGITFAKWGDHTSPYFVIPLLGPSTFRDGMGLMLNYAILTPYPYLSNTLNYSLIGLRYVDLRSQMLETDRLLNEGLDHYSFMRDAYLQHRHYLITGEQPIEQGDNGLYVDGDDEKTSPSVGAEEPENGTPTPAPLTTA